VVRLLHLVYAPLRCHSFPFDSMSWTEAVLVAVFLVPALLIGLWVNLLRRELRNDAETKKKLH
jgi:hypothetical protein